jgi:hypothetical protein
MDKTHKEEFQRELKEALLAHLNEENQVIVVRDLDGTALSGFNETENDASFVLVDRVKAIVAALTDGWSVTKDKRDLSKDGQLHELGKPIKHPGDDYDEAKATRGVVFEIETPFRPFTADEQAAEDAKKAERDAYWAKRHAIRAWLDSGPDINTPPPDGIGVRDLLDQVVWWVTKDKRPMRIGEMEPSHRANLLRLMERQASAWKEAELMGLLSMGAPDEVWSSSENTPAATWLEEQRLYQALRHLVLVDQVGEDACRIEWSDDKPVGCLTGAKGHVCVRDAGHKKRCVCRCDARPAKKSVAAEKAIAARQEALVGMLFPEPTPSTGRAVHEDVAAQFMDLGATSRMNLNTDNEDGH